MKAYEVIEQNDWCQFYTAKNDDGLGTDALNLRAASFSAMGAILKSYGVETISGLQFASRKARKVMRTLQNELYNEFDGYYGKKGSITAWNDDTGNTKKEIVSILKKVETSMGIA